MGAPAHVALHTKMVSAMKAAVMASAKAGPPPPPSYSFHATDDPDADIPAIRAELRVMYQEIEKMAWANMPLGSIQVMMLGDRK
ncbi:conserved hypothetical protein [Paraburkholderia ribeironis]|uniref:Uncharacterized protein n=1 Tax=Paraburkholderia ribeironis TaxID=1247936 RepID=A0A1N7SGG7_9BURK|nr:hypothetical protein [Paraburkholderia ribeironis]SIT46451.1 conserved hypothetical protein [Paraburkholderia ribeironis]